MWAFEDQIWNMWKQGERLATLSHIAQGVNNHKRPTNEHAANRNQRDAKQNKGERDNNWEEESTFASDSIGKASKRVRFEWDKRSNGHKREKNQRS